VSAYRLRMFGLIPPLILGVTLLFLRHRYAGNSRVQKALRWFAIVVGAGSASVAALYLPGSRLILIWVLVCATLGILNSQFYLFLARNRGISFALAAIPFHLLYHFYNGLSFIIGLFLHVLHSRDLKREASLMPAPTMLDHTMD
jgi:hypothetical protein